MGIWAKYTDNIPGGGCGGVYDGQGIWTTSLWKSRGCTGEVGEQHYRSDRIFVQST